MTALEPNRGLSPPRSRPQQSAGAAGPVMYAPRGPGVVAAEYITLPMTAPVDGGPSALTRESDELKRQQRSQMDQLLKEQQLVQQQLEAQHLTQRQLQAEHHEHRRKVSLLQGDGKAGGPQLGSPVAAAQGPVDELTGAPVLAVVASPQRAAYAAPPQGSPQLQYAASPPQQFVLSPPQEFAPSPPQAAPPPPTQLFYVQPAAAAQPQPQQPLQFVQSPLSPVQQQQQLHLEQQRQLQDQFEQQQQQLQLRQQQELAAAAAATQQAAARVQSPPQCFAPAGGTPLLSPAQLQVAPRGAPLSPQSPDGLINTAFPVAQGQVVAANYPGRYSGCPEYDLAGSPHGSYAPLHALLPEYAGDVRKGRKDPGEWARVYYKQRERDMLTRDAEIRASPPGYSSPQRHYGHPQPGGSAPTSYKTPGRVAGPASGRYSPTSARPGSPVAKRPNSPPAPYSRPYPSASAYPQRPPPLAGGMSPRPGSPVSKTMPPPRPLPTGSHAKGHSPAGGSPKGYASVR
eukprot:TRINITY_DN6365_c1_g1_i2.p1 TRINITY_DN6365_c1_g1~~TRINITY_DN6365_c1_g1_i2.p1  ORF type:complete len:538 (+),score=191.46 TRINITY_DN6365_c1_g1_i2:76-1614(+)